MRGLLHTITTLTCPSPKEVATLTVITAIGAAAVTAVVWTLDLLLTAGVSIL